MAAEAARTMRIRTAHFSPPGLPQSRCSGDNAKAIRAFPAIPLMGQTPLLAKPAISWLTIPITTAGCDGSVQQRLSAAGTAQRSFIAAGASDKLYSLSTLFMWHPVDLHNPKLRASGLREALVAHIAAHSHHLLVCRGEMDGSIISTEASVAEQLVGTLETCSVFYVGSSHMRPVAPYCAFALSPELGVARLEYLVDYGSLPSPGNKWLTNAVASIIWVLFRERSDIQEVALPVRVGEQKFDGFAIREIKGRCYASRT